MLRAFEEVEGLMILCVYYVRMLIFFINILK